MYSAKKGLNLMGYSFGLFRVRGAEVDHLSKVTDETVLPLGYSIEKIKESISSLLPLMEWDGKRGQITSVDWGRFECLLNDDPNNKVIVFSTSIHVDYKQYVIDVAKFLDLSAFDAQTGECVYMQKSF
jgi:hypothetical protein